jgi:hypothetical protein
MRHKSGNELAKDLKALLAEYISPSISDIVLFVALVAHDDAAYVACSVATATIEPC